MPKVRRHANGLKSRQSARFRFESHHIPIGWHVTAWEYAQRNKFSGRRPRRAGDVRRTSSARTLAAPVWRDGCPSDIVRSTKRPTAPDGSRGAVEDDDADHQNLDDDAILASSDDADIDFDADAVDRDFDDGDDPNVDDADDPDVDDAGR
jgi:hypothetical protein